MNRYQQYLLIVLFPFYPLWAWIFNFVSHKALINYANLIWLPLVIFLLFNRNNRMPKYLIFLILFTIYHIFSVYYFDLLEDNNNWFTFIRGDFNVTACAALFVIENTKFEDWFFKVMNRNILIIILISLLVGLVQISNPHFFYNIDLDPDFEYAGEGRVFSIYSWIDLNTLGITFPLLITIMLSVIDSKRKEFAFIVLSAIIIGFLTRARYVMISIIIIFSQLLIGSAISLKRKIYFAGILVASIVLLIIAADKFGFDIQETIDDRILEKNKEIEMGSAMARVTSYYVFLTKFPEHPWFGVGPKTRDDVIQLLNGEAPLIHVGYLSYLYFYGVAGSLFLFISLFLLLQRAWVIGRQCNYWGSFYGFIAFCFANTTFVYFNLSETGVILAILYLKLFQDRFETDQLEDENSLNSLALV
jgi:hypothetical protein